jgi:hypothetical protein
MRERVRAGNVGFRNARSIIQGRNVLFGMFGGKVLRGKRSKASDHFWSPA